MKFLNNCKNSQLTLCFDCAEDFTRLNLAQFAKIRTTTRVTDFPAKEDLVLLLFWGLSLVLC